MNDIISSNCRNTRRYQYQLTNVSPFDATLQGRIHLSTNSLGQRIESMILMMCSDPSKVRQRSWLSPSTSFPSSQSKQSMSIESDNNYNEQSRRNLFKKIPRWIALITTATTSSLISISSFIPPINAAVVPTPVSETKSSIDDIEITQKVVFKVRISRADGTFYVKDEQTDPNDYDNQVFTGQLVMGLFGKYAPTHVEKFLSYINSPDGGTVFDDNPYPNYSRSMFTKFDQLTGIVTAGDIPKLELMELNGSNVLKYGTRLIPATLWIDKIPTEQRIRHIGVGLITHRQLDPSPQFGITTRTDTSMLDSTNVVFGRVLLDESSKEFLLRVAAIPTYSVDRPASFDNDADGGEALVQEAASVIFNAQRDFFRSAAKSFGDDRISKVYDGKFLRRVEVTQVSVL
jgi:cyclophilin family peptidyl-prolyl cis-trans isomerase